MYFFLLSLQKTIENSSRIIIPPHIHSFDPISTLKRPLIIHFVKICPYRQQIFINLKRKIWWPPQIFEKKIKQLSINSINSKTRNQRKPNYLDVTLSLINYIERWLLMKVGGFRIETELKVLGNFRKLKKMFSLAPLKNELYFYVIFYQFLLKFIHLSRGMVKNCRFLQVPKIRWRKMLIHR